MTNQTPLTEVVSVSNGYIQAGRELLALYATLKELAARASDNGVATILAQIPTVAIKNDGSLATVQDQAPVQTNPIDPVAYPDFLQPVSMQQLVQAKTVLDAIITFVEGGAVSANPGARAILHGINRK